MADLHPTVCDGFEEVEHTAEWAYRVWGASLEELFVRAAAGLYSLAGVELENSPHVDREIHLDGIDRISLLVAWLNELLFLFESEGLAFDRFEILQLDGGLLRARVSGAPVKEWMKHIKAATYSNLSIRQTDAGVEATVVLDV
ncbi:MAG: archease [Synechococcus sp.]